VEDSNLAGAGIVVFVIRIRCILIPRHSGLVDNTRDTMTGVRVCAGHWDRGFAGRLGACGGWSAHRFSLAGLPLQGGGRRGGGQAGGSGSSSSCPGKGSGGLDKPGASGAARQAGGRHAAAADAGSIKDLASALNRAALAQEAALTAREQALREAQRLFELEREQVGAGGGGLGWKGRGRRRAMLQGHAAGPCCRVARCCRL
jgi:hypothetical protein